MAYLDMKFNTAKSTVLRIGKSRNKACDSILLCGVNLQFVSTVKYLGVYVKSANVYKINLHESQSKYFWSTNSIFYNCRGNMCETGCRPAIPKGRHSEGPPFRKVRHSENRHSGFAGE